MSDLYRPTQLENVGILDSYNKAGGIAGTGLGLQDWKLSMGLGDVDKGMFGNAMDFMGSDGFKGGLAALGLGKDLIGGYLSWKNSQDMKDMMGKEFSIKQEMWNRQKDQIDRFNKDRDALNASYSSPSVNTSPVFKPANGLAYSEVQATEQQSPVFRKQPEKQATAYNY